MNYKRLSIFAGLNGSGKTNIAVNFAKHIKSKGDEVTVCDLDIVNPYFRTKDSENELRDLGINLIASQFANTNLDAPAIPKEIYSIIAARDICGVLDIGGDDRGALALGRYAPDILDENNYEMYLVVNFSRPLTRNFDDVIVVINEIEDACKIKFTKIVNNTNIGDETTKEVVLSGYKKTCELSEKTGLPISFTSVERRLFNELNEIIPDLFPLDLQKRIINS
ncbi:MAG TPA: hypothetical protein GXZ23_03880 [Clostridiales bacterium]|nr:hypothetical protein [Clostridiales bacterium]